MKEALSRKVAQVIQSGSADWLWVPASASVKGFYLRPPSNLQYSSAEAGGRRSCACFGWRVLSAN